ncbi:hypothetical protein SAMN05443999_10446 [Roseovarius azorensis]|uniref:Uncharacterized protein n=1 Tax=Roseovarius azorensis TaxID=1287727 RepID=A0A1H7N6U1_9RHOB|nr:hypothetical protein SAMN05443999_10446 [Roseovarius azorensis]
MHLSGVDPYETKTVLFTEWMMGGDNPGKQMIFVTPHRTMGVEYGIRNGKGWLSPEKYPGRRKKPLNVDRWVIDGKVRFMWTMGITWFPAMLASQELASRVAGVGQATTPNNASAVPPPERPPQSRLAADRRSRSGP